ncbi:MAG: hypothetical protein ACSLEW_08700 [Nocardioides sp.]
MKFRGRPGVRGAARAVPVAALALLLLSGCAELTPGTAAVVNGTRITNDEVDDFADAQCVARERAAKSDSSTALAVSRVQQNSLGLLMDTELSLQYAEDQGIEPEKSLSQGLYSQYEPGITPLPSKARTVLTDVFQAWARGRAILIEAGSRSTGEAPSFTNLDKLIDAGLQERDSWLKKAEITTDPRYAPTEQGFPGGGDSSVSRAGSDFAKGAAAKEPDPKWIAGLPASQTCG